MPKLNAKKAKEVDAAESTFEPIPEGLWLAKLLKVESKEAAESKNVYWQWEYEVHYEVEKDGKSVDKMGKIWDNTSLAENAAWRMKMVFDGFGVPVDTDTDELCGKWVQLQIVQRVIEKGARKGDIGNNVAKIVPVDDAPDAAEVPSFE